MIIINKEYIFICAIFVLIFLVGIIYIINLRNNNKRLTKSNIDMAFSAKRYLAVFNTKFIGIETFDKHGYLTGINDEARRILGIEESVEDFVKKHFNYRDFENTKLKVYKSGTGVDVSYEEYDRLAIVDSMHAGNFLDGHIEYDLKDSKAAKIIAPGRRDGLVLSVKIIPIIIDGQLDGFVSMFIDITKQIHTRKEIEKEQALMMKVFDNIPIAIFIKDTKNNNKIIYRNNKSVKMFGGDVFQSTDMYYNEEEAEKIKKIDRQVLETGELMIYRNYMKLKSGKQIDHIVYKSVMGSVEDGILVIAVIESTIKDELQKTNKIFSIKSDNLRAFTWDYNLTANKVEYANHATATSSHHDLDSFLKTLSTEDQVMIHQLLDDARNGLKKEFVYDYSIFNLNTNKTEYWESRVIAENINTGNEKQTHLYGIDLDITNQVESIKKLEEAKKFAEKANESKSMFLANMSHEIRTPLNAIVGFSNLLIDADDREDREEFSNIINANSNILLDLINSILDMSRIGVGIINFKYEVFNVSELIDSTILSFKQRFETDELKIYQEKSHEVCNIELDRRHLLQIITNFMSNAVKFTTKGSIILGYTYSDEKLRVYVKDTGVGIPEYNLDKVFNRFEKLNNIAQGTGLGMYICKTITQHLAGNIGVESEYGKGSTFWVELPCTANIED